MKVIMVFIDGFGIGTHGPGNPFLAANIPSMRHMLGTIMFGSGEGWFESDISSVLGVDATLGVPGIPQSATGQATLLTGVNAPKLVGRHINAFPTGLLEILLKEKSIFAEFGKANYLCTFANAFRNEAFQKMQEGTYQPSATTVAALGAGLRLRGPEDLCSEKAVYQDLTNESLLEQGYDLPLFTPKQAGRIVSSIAKDYDFTLFEYFQTDKAGHSGDISRAVSVLEMFDEFFSSLVKSTDLSRSCILLVSDHGNIEDMTVNTHTLNRVPVALVGSRRDLRRNALRGVSSITDVPAIIRKVFEGRRHG